VEHLCCLSPNIKDVGDYFDERIFEANKSSIIIEMDAGSVVTSLVKEYAAERPQKMATYCQHARMRGRSYLFEMMDDINGCYVSKAAFTDKDSVLFLIPFIVLLNKPRRKIEDQSQSVTVKCAKDTMTYNVYSWQNT
jgi:hypothetical protein